MAVLALVGTMMTGCASDDINNEAPQAKTNNTVTLTTTISLDGGATTRALDAQGKKTFAKGDQIAILYKDANDKSQKALTTALEESDITDNGKKAKITVTLNSPKASGQLRCIYPAAMLSGDFNPELNPDINDENTINLLFANNQDGTLATIANNYDLAVYDGTFTSDAKLPGSIPLKNQLAIVAFTINDYDGTNDITNTITKLEIDQGPGLFHYTVTRTAAAGPIYVAMMPSESAKENITISATDVTTTLEKTVKDVTLAANNMYPVTVKTFKVVDLSTLTSDYEAKNGEMLTGTLDANVKISIAAGATVTLKDANINMDDDGHAKWTSGDYAGITCLGDATIILEGTNKVHAFRENYPGIQAAHNYSGEEFTLTIQGVGDGSLVVTGGDKAAGIGGGWCQQFCNIVIYSGTITATGGSNAAGIGSGCYPALLDGDIPCGDITISGGTITAKGGDYAAGIGSGYQNQCGNINILDGTITATGGVGGVGGAGIGGSNGGRCGVITISGGTIEEAKGGDNGAGIGSGTEGTCGDIKISGGTIEKALGGVYAAGIGSGRGIDVGGAICYATCGAITISGDATITKATGGKYAAGIGSSYYGTCGDIKISGGTIQLAQGGDNAAGIGCGGYSNASCGNIKISGGTIKQTIGGRKGAGIGNAQGGKCGDITIEGGTIEEAQGGTHAAGIGGGQSTKSIDIGDITIEGGTITAKGATYAAGIGSGYQGECKKITISGGTIKAQGGENAAGIGSGKGESGLSSSCGDITITTGVSSVTAQKGNGATLSIGKGYNNSTCGTVTIGCTLDASGNPVGGTTGEISDSPYTYTPSN